MEVREQGRRLREHEWREAMEKLEAERVMKEQAWHEREDQRRAREEAKAVRRDELFAALVNKLFQEGLVLSNGPCFLDVKMEAEIIRFERLSFSLK
ncbi:hypothetical protein KI387_016689 [Taxus chinensis]|uniref:Uncharacterized protein n=1 Tax=Taxus chinensis TaxID=29808 RepID=A0AA38GJB6_TAXCH|nr:hypothetical protein KI387_016689 [Taxus chinensis]